MYTEIVKQQRRQVAQLTLRQQYQLLNLYDDSIMNLSRRAEQDGIKELTKRWMMDYTKQLTEVRDNLEKKLNSQLENSIQDGAKIGTRAEQKIMGDIFKKANVTVPDSFSDMFSQVQDNVVKDIMSGELYKDNRTLSARIWNYGEDFERDIQYVINQAILEKKSAVELAKDLEKYVNEPAKRTTDWGKCYPRLKNKKVDYNAMRLARTSINHSYQTATIQSSQMNPFVEGIKWLSAFAHGRTCQLCIDRATKDQYGLGPGVFPKDDVPLDHPNGLCTMAPHIKKSTMEVADELHNWLYGKEDNAVLDEWYQKHTDLLAGKPIPAVITSAIRKEFSNKFEKAVDVVYSYGIQTGNEGLMWLDEAGEQLVEFAPGNHNSAPITQEAYEYLLNANERTIISLHNHPKSSSFSPEDLHIASRYESIKELWVVGHDDTRYYLDIKDGERPGMSEIKDEYRKVKNELFEKYYQEYLETGDADRIWKEHTHEINQRLAEHFDWEYRRELK